LSPAYKEIQDKMINTLKENHHELLERVMLGAIVDGLVNNYDFQNRLATEVDYIIRNRRANENN
jgi:hypothetical protein